MAQVTVTINGKNYRMACDDGEEDRLKELAGNFDDYVKQLREQFGEIGDLRLTVMAGLMVADALGESERRAAELQQELAGLRQARAAVADQKASEQRQLAGKLNTAAERIEDITKAMNRALSADGKEQ